MQLRFFSKKQAEKAAVTGAMIPLIIMPYAMFRLLPMFCFLPLRRYFGDDDSAGLIASTIIYATSWLLRSFFMVFGFVAGAAIGYLLPEPKLALLEKIETDADLASYVRLLQGQRDILLEFKKPMYLISGIMVDLLIFAFFAYQFSDEDDDFYQYQSVWSELYVYFIQGFLLPTTELAMVYAVLVVEILWSHRNGPSAEPEVVANELLQHPEEATVAEEVEQENHSDIEMDSEIAPSETDNPGRTPA